MFDLIYVIVDEFERIQQKQKHLSNFQLEMLYYNKKHPKIEIISDVGYEKGQWSKEEQKQIIEELIRLVELVFRINKTNKSEYSKTQTIKYNNHEFYKKIEKKYVYEIVKKKTLIVNFLEWFNENNNLVFNFSDFKNNLKDFEKVYLVWY